MAEHGSCWTCRLRRKKCDREQPACRTCSVLKIRCHYSANRPEWMEGGEKQEEMTRRLKLQVKQGKEVRRERDYVQVLSIASAPMPHVPPLPDATTADSMSGGDKDSTPRSMELPGSCVRSNGSLASKQLQDAPAVQSTFRDISPYSAVNDLDVDFTMMYLDHVFPFLFPFYSPPMIQGGRAWVLDLLRNNNTMFHAAMSLSTFFFTLVLSSDDVSGHEGCRRIVWQRLDTYSNVTIKSLQEEMLALNQQRSKATLLQQVTAMESITQLMVFEAAMAKTSELDLHLAAAISLLEEIFEGSKLDGCVDIRRVIAGLERPSWMALVSDRPVWNTDQAAFRFFLAYLLWADIISSTSLRTVPRLRKHYRSLICHQYGSDATEPLIQMEEYVGCEGWALVAIADAVVLERWKREEQSNGTFTAEALAQWGDQIYQGFQTSLKEFEERSTKREDGSRNTILHSFYRSSDANQHTQQVAATRIWAHAARIFLTVVIFGWQPRHPFIRESVGEVLRFLQEAQSPAILRNSVWPFCVAGCLADADQEQDFKALAAASGALQSFGTVGHALQISEHVWKRRAKLSMDWDLTACFEIMGTPVLLL
ncbi:hypothetical protein GQ53DRAFT_716304 [Thozetella sp. PMI_491]|nr:hypothetical protein GQ53DRAFT_716304 [Thozetella sp. PMI_491]